MTSKHNLENPGQKEIENIRKHQKMINNKVDKINGFSFYEIAFFIVIISISLICKMLGVSFS